ncbi:MAG: hypothetical protein Q8P52_01255 [bacterium]|nr:hypothetical protein [bacterium]
MRSKHEKLVQFILRIGLAFPFVYAAVGGFMNPTAWTSFFPPFATNYLPEQTLLLAWGVFEFILAAWILFGRRIFWPSIIAATSLTGLIFFNWGARDIIFRDISILAIALALAISNRKKN